MLALDALYQYDILLGDAASNLHNFVMSDDGQAMWLVDCFDNCQGSVAELARETHKLRQMLSTHVWDPLCVCSFTIIITPKLYFQ